MPPLPHLRLPSLHLLLLLLLPHASQPQQVGSFFTAIYLNGAPVAAYQSSCAAMGQSQYCCSSGQSCAWDDAGKVACCPAGSNCQGSPYEGAAATVGAAYTTTVYPQPTTTDCGCETAGATNVVPVAPVTVVTSYYSVPTSTRVPASSVGSTTTTTVQAGQGGFVTTVVSGGGGGGMMAAVPSTKGLIACASVSTITEVNVGQPVRTVGCLIVINEGLRNGEGALVVAIFGVFGLVGALLF